METYVAETPIAERVYLFEYFVRGSRAVFEFFYFFVAVCTQKWTNVEGGVYSTNIRLEVFFFSLLFRLGRIPRLRAVYYQGRVLLRRNWWRRNSTVCHDACRAVVTITSFCSVSRWLEYHPFDWSKHHLVFLFLSFSLFFFLEWT